MKLKSLRGALGSYGRVKAGGIVEVTDDQARKLKATKRFVDATPADITAAQKAQEAAMAVQVQGVSPGFQSVAAPAASISRLQDLISRGDIGVAEARRLVGLQIDLAPEEIRAQILEDVADGKAELDRLRAAHDERQDELDGRQEALDARAAELDARQAQLEATAEDLDAREAELQDTPPPADADAAAPDADAAAAKRKSGK